MSKKESHEAIKFPSPKTDTQKVIKQIVDRVSKELDEYNWPWDTLAEKANVSLSTVYRFRDRQYRDSPLLSTVLKIAKAVGLEVRVDSKRKKVSVRRAG